MTVLTVTSLGTPGDGISRLPTGQVVFIPDTLPGDVVEIEIDRGRSKKKLLFGKVKKMIEPSAERVPSRCKVDACGGCVLREWSQDGQAGFKESRVREALRRIGKIEDVPEASLIRVGDGWNYRHRARLHCFFSGRSWRFGYRRRRSHRVAPFGGCPVLWPELDRQLAKLTGAIVGLPPEAGLKEVEIAYSRLDKAAAATVIADGDIDIFRDGRLWKEKAGLAGVEFVTPKEHWKFGRLELRYDHEASADYDILFEPGVFTQANPAVNAALVREVLAKLPERSNVLELHAGIGNFSLPMAKAGHQVIAFELNRRSSVLAERNAQLAGLSIKCIQDEDAAAIELLGGADVLVMDPPRNGARPLALALADASERPSKVVYISCDSATLARDVGVMVDSGYRLESLQTFDMFSNTPHVEALVTLVDTHEATR